MSSAAPARLTLRGALDALAAGDAEALVRLQAELIDAQASRLARVDVESTEATDMLARRAARDGRVTVLRHEDSAEIAAPVGRDGDVELVAVHRLIRATPMIMALAEERLELTTALFRARAGAGNSEWAGAEAIARAFAEATTTSAAWFDAAVALKDLADARRIVLARVGDGRVTLVADSAGAVASSELLASLRLAAGEAVDLGAPLDPGDPPPPALRVFAGNQTLHARNSSSGRRGAVVIALGAAIPAALQPAAHLLVALRPPPRTILPSRLVDAVVRRLPARDGEAAADRQRRARRAILLAPLLLLLVPVPITVGAPVTVEALDQRVVTAPFDGRIESVAAEPGDRVQAGRTVLARLDSRQAESERGDVVAQLQAALSAAGVARTEGRGDDARQAQLQAQQLSARAQSLALQISSAELRAPIDGVLGGDDLRRRIGSPVSRGETLFVVAAPGRYRAEAKVSDRDIGNLRVGQNMSLALRARVLSRPTAIVARIYPIAEVVQGDNIFRVIGTIDKSDSAGLLPGMEGRASVRTSWAPLGWALLKGPVRWVRQSLWI